jgi:hypothetical protein
VSSGGGDGSVAGRPAAGWVNRGGEEDTVVVCDVVIVRGALEEVTTAAGEVTTAATAGMDGGVCRGGGEGGGAGGGAPLLIGWTMLLSSTWTRRPAGMFPSQVPSLSCTKTLAECQV